MEIEVTRDQQILRNMDQALDQFDAGLLNMLGLIDRLEEDCTRLSPNPSWTKAFTAEWFTLDVLYGSASGKGLKVMPAEDVPFAEKAIHEIRRLVAQRMHGPSSDDATKEV